MNISNLMILKILIGVVLVSIVVVLAIGTSLFMTTITGSKEGETQEVITETSHGEGLDQAEDHSAAIERAERMHVEGYSYPTEEEIARMDMMNSTEFSDPTEEEIARMDMMNSTEFSDPTEEEIARMDMMNSTEFSDPTDDEHSVPLEAI